jgi:hypothetical protein
MVRAGAGLLPVIEPLLKDPDHYIRDKALDYYRATRRAG